MIDVLCLDANVLIKLLVQEEPLALTVAARGLYARVEQLTAILVAPAFAWAEVGSTLRKKMRTGELTEAQARVRWDDLLALPIDYLDMQSLRARAWEIAHEYNLPTLYDTAYLACTELAPADEEPRAREFWTADERLLGQLGDRLPPYVRQLR